MGRESTVSFEQSLAEINNIVADHGKVTTRGVRERLGRGSFATIGKHVRTYKAGLNQQANFCDDTIDPAIIQGIRNQLVARIQTATASITASLADQQTEYDSLLTYSEQQDADLEFSATKQASLLAENAALSGSTEQLQSSVKDLTAELAQERTKTEYARVELAKAQLQLETLLRIKLDIENVRQELDSVRDKAAIDRAEAAANVAKLHEVAAVAVAKMEGEILFRENLEANLAEVSQQRNDALEAAKKSSTEAAELRGQLVALKMAPKMKPAMA